jgi:hypothetical protein
MCTLGHWRNEKARFDGFTFSSPVFAQNAPLHSPFLPVAVVIPNESILSLQRIDE